MERGPDVRRHPIMEHGGQQTIDAGGLIASCASGVGRVRAGQGVESARDAIHWGGLCPHGRPFGVVRV